MGLRGKEWNPKQNYEICQLKARINIECLSSFSAKYQNCINDDGKHRFTINRQLTENTQHFLYWRRAGWQNRFNTLGYSDTVGFFWYFVIGDLVFHILWSIWPIYYDTYPPVFLLPVKGQEEDGVWLLSQRRTHRPHVPRGPGWKQLSSLCARRLSLPNGTAAGTPAAVAATFSQNSPPDRLRNPICPSTPSTDNISSFLLRGLCEISCELPHGQMN